MSNQLAEEAMAALFHASVLGRTDVVQSAIASLRTVILDPGQFRALLSRQRPEDGASALHLASHHNHSDVVRALLNVDCDLEVLGTSGEFIGKKPYNSCGNSTTLQAYHVFLFEAVAMNKLDRILKLLNGGVPIDIVDGGPNRESLLHWSCSFGHTDASRILLEHACDANALNLLHESPLLLACKAKNAPLVSMLLEEGAYSDVDLLASKPSVEIAQLLQQTSKPTFKPSYPLRTIYEQRQLVRKAAAAAVKANDPFSQVEWEDERLARKALRQSEGSAESSEDEEDYLARQPLLVLWPPAQRQRRTLGAPLILQSNSIIYISVVSSDIDIYPLLTWSGLMDVFDSFGLTAQVKRSVPGSSLSLCIDRSLCPKPHQFELVITQDRAMLVAADQTGLLYSIYAFIQLMQLHSEVVVVRNGKVSSVEPTPTHGDARSSPMISNTYPSSLSGGINLLNGTAISLYPLVINDWPDIANRAVMWSHRRAARLNARVLRAMVQLLSKMRINMIHLVVDCLHSSIDKTANVQGDNTANRIGTNDNVGTLENHDNTKLFAIFEVCSRHCVELIPTVVVSSLRQCVDIELLRNCSSKSLNVLFLFEQRALANEMLEALSSSVSEDATVSVSVNNIHINRKALTTRGIENVVSLAITNILQQAQLAGFCSVCIGASAWTQKAANPLRIASNLGIAAILHPDMDVVYPSALFTKPVVSAQGFMSTMSECVAKARGDVLLDSPTSSGGCNLSVFPAYMDSDFMTPMLMLKYYSFLHAGFTWNGSAMREMGLGIEEQAHLGRGMGAVADIIKEVAGLLLFPEEVRQQKNKSSNKFTAPNADSFISADILDTVMAIFTGSILANESEGTMSNANSKSMQLSTAADSSNSSSNNSQILHASPPSPRHRASDENAFPLRRLESDDSEITASAELVLVERIIWSFITSKTSVADALVPTKTEAALCLRYCRRVLNASKWHSPSKGKKSLFENMGGMLNNLTASIGTGTSNTKEQNHADENACKTDIDELFSCITVMSVVSRALVLSYNQQKMQNGSISNDACNSVLTLERLMSYLPLGTTSDVANSLLEAVEQCTAIWRKRFENMAFLEQAAQIQTLNTNFAGEKGGLQARNTVEGAARTYLLQERPSLPCRSFFEVLKPNKQKQDIAGSQQQGEAKSSLYSLFF